MRKHYGLYDEVVMLGIVILILMFWGDPDLHDFLIQYTHNMVNEETLVYPQKLYEIGGHP